MSNPDFDRTSVKMTFLYGRVVVEKKKEMHIPSFFSSGRAGRNNRSKYF